MKTRTIMMLTSGLATLLITPNAAAVYTGLQVALQRITLRDGTLMNRYRVYALFDHPNDYLKTVHGSAPVGNLVIESRNETDTASGSNFFNPLGGSNTAPFLAAIALNSDVAHDTFGTIGVAIAEHGSQPIPNSPDYTGLLPGFTGIGDTSQINVGYGGWFVHGPVEQGRAGYLGDGDPLLRVLMLQLTVSSTSNVRGTLAMAITESLPTGPQANVVASQTFNSIPSPGALGIVLAGALMTYNCRRRISIATA